MRRMIVLAAGRGTRLGALTDEMPKCMVPLEGTPLLSWLIRQARDVVPEVVVVRGYQGQRLPAEDGVVFVDNPEFATTNMAYSLWCARDWFDDGFLLSYSDIFYNASVLAAVARSPAPIGVAVDRQWLPYWRRRFEDVVLNAETLRWGKAGTISDIGRRPERVEDIDGQYIGLLAFQGTGVRALREYMQDRTVRTVRDAPPPLEAMYMTDVLRGLIDAGHEVVGISVNGGWLEVDTPNDLELARQLVRKEGDRLVVER